MTKVRVYITILKEIAIDYIWVGLSSAIALLLSLWTLLPSWYIQTNFSSEYNYVTNTIIQGISLSYIAGSIFFVISVVIPNLCRRLSILPFISDKLVELRKAFFDFMAVSSTNQDYSTDFDLKSFVERVIKEDCKQYCEEETLSVEEFDSDVHFKPEYLFALSLPLQWLDETLFEIQAMASWLSPEDLRVLSTIKHDSLVSQIRGRCGGNMKTSYGIEDITIRFGILKKCLLEYKHSRNALNELVKKYEKYHISENQSEGLALK